MLFNAIRIVTCLGILTFTIYKIRNSNIVRKKLVSIVTFILILLVVSATASFPVENLFFDFKSPESVFKYTNFGKIEQVIQGEKSCLVVYKKDNSTSGFYIIPKTEKGYKIPSYSLYKRVSHRFDSSGLFDVYNVQGTEDYYVFASLLLNEYENQIEIFNADTKIDSKIVRVSETDFIYFYLKNFTSDYFLVFNGQKTVISE